MTGNRCRAWRVVKPLAIAGLVAFGLLQVVPYGWSHSNPSVTSTPPWPTSDPERLERREQRTGERRVGGRLTRRLW